MVKLPGRLAGSRGVEPDPTQVPAARPRVRPVFLVALLVAVLALVVQRTFFPPFKPPVWKGTTTQGEVFRLGWIGASLDALYTRVELGCSDGVERFSVWSPRQGVETDFVRRGSEVSAGDVDELPQPDAGTTCDSGDIGWSVARYSRAAASVPAHTAARPRPPIA